jgi:dephospho-CoA kinase
VTESLLPDDFSIKTYKRELSINGIKLLSPEELWEELHLFEYWSQLIIKDFFKKQKPKVISSIFPSKRPKDAKTIILVGEIASGKTSILTELTKSKLFHYVSARQSLIEILKIPDFKNKDRSEFQEKAQALITSHGGPGTLARNISEKVDHSKITLVDGIRNIATIRELKELIGDCIIVYVDCPRDKALENYKKRAGKHFDNDQFVRAREHPTELELPLILAEADAILFNADDLSTTIKIFSNWLK